MARIAHIAISGPTRATTFARATEPSNLISDGRRYVAFSESSRQPLQVFDAATRRVKRTASTCAAQAAIPGVVLTCNRLLNLRSGRDRPVPGVQRGDDLYELGRYWAEGEVDVPCSDPLGCSPADVVVNWHTGERHLCSDPPYPACPRRGWDLDRSNLREASRPPAQPDGPVVGYDGPFRLERHVVGIHDVLRLRRGHTMRTIAQLRCCVGALFDPSLSAGWATWGEHRQGALLDAAAYSVGRHQTWRWVMRGFPQPLGESVIVGAPLSVVHVWQGAVFATMRGYTRDKHKAVFIDSYSLTFAQFPGR